MDLIKNCHCNYKGKNCRYIGKLMSALSSLGDEYSLDWVQRIEIKSDIKDAWAVKRIIGHCEFSLVVSCSCLKSVNINQLRRLFVSSFDDTANECYDESDENEECLGDYWALSPEEKVQKVADRLNLPSNQIKIKKSDQVKGFTDGESITLTTGEIDLLDEDELAFVLAHEQAHVEKSHIKKNKDFLKEKIKQLDGILENKKLGVIKKALKIAGTSFMGVGQFTEMRHKFEFEADKRAQEILDKAGYSEAGGNNFLERYINNDSSLTHPASKTRKERIKK